MSAHTQAPPQKWMRHLRNNMGRQAALLRSTAAGGTAPAPGAPRLRELLVPNWNNVATVWAETVQPSRVRHTVSEPEAVAAFLAVLGEATALGRSKTPPAEGDGLLGLVATPGGLRTFRFYQDQRRLIDMQNWEVYAYPDQLHRRISELVTGDQR